MVNFSDMNKPKVLNFGNGDILIYEPTETIADEIIALQENYYNENHSNIPKYIIYKDVIPKLTNLNIDIENELEYEELMSNPPIWLRAVLDEIDNIIVRIDKIKVDSIKAQLNELENIVDKASRIIEIPENVQTFIKENQERLLETKDDKMIEGLQMMGLIEKPEEKQETEEEKEIRELEEKLNKLKGKVGA